MPERPLVLFAAPTVADKERRYGGAPKYYFPSHSRQVSRLTPQFNVLQNTMNSGSIYFTNYATGVDPEYTLVFLLQDRDERSCGKVHRDWHEGWKQGEHCQQ